MNEYIFTNCGATGHLGCTQAQVNAVYNNTNLSGNVTINIRGIQEWTVPKTSYYLIEAYGAQGGRGHSSTNSVNHNMGGKGAFMSGNFLLTQGQKLYILVGQQGGLSTRRESGGGGGGGTFVATGTSLNTSIPLIVAGGGGGGGTQNYTGLTNVHGEGGFITNDGDFAGKYLHTTSYIQPGASFSQNSSGYSGTHPLAFRNGGVGGSGLYNTLGGFGGGGDVYYSGGGAGGYTGGSTRGDYRTILAGGGGGGSYNTGQNQKNTPNFREGHGLIKIKEMLNYNAFIKSEGELYTYKDGLWERHYGITNPTAEYYKDNGMISLEQLFIPKKIYSFNSIESNLGDGQLKKVKLKINQLKGISKVFVKGIEIIDNGSYKSWGDGTYARCAYEYRYPIKNGYFYQGDIGDGIYRIQPDINQPPMDVYCDMTRFGGGWTLVINSGAKGSRLNNINQVGVLTSPTQTTVSKLSDDVINTLRGDNLENSIIWFERPNNPLYFNNHIFFRENKIFLSTAAGSTSIFMYYTTLENSLEKVNAINGQTSYGSALQTWAGSSNPYRMILDYGSEGCISANNYEGNRSERGALVWVRKI